MTINFDPNHQSATINLPSRGQNSQPQRISCVFHASEGKRLIVESQERLTTSAPASVDYDDSMFLGEVISCTPLPNGNWRVEMHIEQILSGLQSLIMLRSRLLGESAESAAGRKSTQTVAA